MAAELWISALPKRASGVGTTDVLKVLSSSGLRGPMYGLRPECAASIWYIGRPTRAGPLVGCDELFAGARKPQAVPPTTASRANVTSPLRGPSTAAVW